MIPKFVTYHPSWGHGLYLSKPGINALATSNPEDFLLHSSYKNEQIIMSGTTAARSDQPPVRVNFPVALPSRPLVVFYISALGFASHVIPWPAIISSDDPNFGLGNKGNRTYRVTCDVATDHMVFTNTSGVVFIHVMYIVMARDVD